MALPRTDPGEWRVAVTGPARKDLRHILRWATEHFGVRQAARYGAAIEAALARLKEGPTVPGSRAAQPGREELRKLPLGPRHRHWLFFRALPDRRILVVRVLHDAMDPARHLPPHGES